MLIREMSDLHLEICPYFVPPMVGDEETILLLSGDIFCLHYFGNETKRFLTEVSTRFHKVLMIPGNHEYYKSHISHFEPKVNAWLTENELNNIHLLNMGSIVIDDVAFIGATLWTDMNKGNPIAKMVVEGGLNDYRKIRTANYRKINANDTILLHYAHKQYIFEQIELYRTIGVRKIVVMSHHAPSELSVHPKYKGNDLNAGYYSNMEYDIMDNGPDIWIHGHMHDTFSYELGITNVICNPRGYATLMQRQKYEDIPIMKAYDPSAENSEEIRDAFSRIFYNENINFDPFFRLEI